MLFCQLRYLIVKLLTPETPINCLEEIDDPYKRAAPCTKTYIFEKKMENQKINKHLYINREKKNSLYL